MRRITTLITLLSGMMVFWLQSCAEDSRNSDPGLLSASDLVHSEMLQEFRLRFSDTIKEILLVPEGRGYNYEMIPHGLSRIRGDALACFIETLEFEYPVVLEFQVRDSGYDYNCFLLRGDRGFCRQYDEVFLIATRWGLFFTCDEFRGNNLYARISGEAESIILEAIRSRLRRANVFESGELLWSPLDDISEIDPFSLRSLGIVDRWPIE